MEKRKKYQVFISSTYRDLIEERTAVMQSLLEIDCIPVGMEQFPASNMSQMEYIRMMLDDCDYPIQSRRKCRAAENGVEGSGTP